MSEALKLSAPEFRIISRLQRTASCVVRQTSDLDGAIGSGGGYLWSIHPGGATVTGSVCLGMIRKGLLVSGADDLFADIDGGGADVPAPISIAGVQGAAAAAG